MCSSLCWVQVFVDSSDTDLLPVGGGEHLNVNDNDSCREIPMDENPVQEENVAQNSGGNKSSYEFGEGSGNVNLVEGHNRSSGEVGEVKW
ncbi:hypothetical protein MtrunA17_Chr4g0071831 [Medicago truncatula]|uniref:Uncharacterized protein n=1 Tax=Medicago truncatula TaxID=3880 RepID=A0A396IGL4_MEDTR|nr:hypothetical protein MtrunA17_Chr4g0071831 [Medicago truncatula]